MMACAKNAGCWTLRTYVHACMHACVSAIVYYKVCVPHMYHGCVY